jgi:hypothetical protein
MTWQPASGWVLVEEVKTEMGIIIPEDMQDPTKSGANTKWRIVKVGEDCGALEVGMFIVPYYNPVLKHQHDNETIFMAKSEFIAAFGKE